MLNDKINDKINSWRSNPFYDEGIRKTGIKEVFIPIKRGNHIAFCYA